MLTADPDTGNIVTTFNGLVYGSSYIDSGSSLFFFEVSAYPICTGVASGLYCPSTTQNLSAVLQGANGASSSVNFSVANADQLASANPTFNAFDNLAAPSRRPQLLRVGLAVLLRPQRVYGDRAAQHAGRTGALLRFLVRRRALVG